jgi:hypothetical protein
MAKNPTSKNRRSRQKLKERYSKAREEAQLHGIIPTSPEGALRDERVSAQTQSKQDTSGLERKAINSGWAVPEEKKPEIVERLIEKVTNPGASAKEVALNARVLLMADKEQWERDNIEEARKRAGGSNVNLAFFEQLQRAALDEDDVIEKRLLDFLEKSEKEPADAARNSA